MSSTPTPEFSRELDPERQSGDGSFAIAANEAERAALAARFGLLAIDRLEAKGRLHLLRGDRRLRLEGKLVADVTQACVVTLDPVPAHLEQDFAVLYGAEERGEVDLNPDAEDVEPLPHGKLDVGEAVAQELLMALDPYPRAPGAAVEIPAEPAPEKPNPFAALAKLKKD